MEIQYRRESRRNFLVIGPERQVQAGYEVKMLVENDIQGLLRFHVKYMDEACFYYYDITSLQPLRRLVEGRWIKKEEVSRLLLQLDSVLNRAAEYFLDGDRLLLEPEYIYSDTQWSRILFCLVPGLDGNFQEGLSRLLQYILKKTDHRDKEGVVLSYGLYQESLKENYGIENLLQLIHREPQEEGREQEKMENPEPAIFREQKSAGPEEHCRGNPDEEERPDGEIQKSGGSLLFLGSLLRRILLWAGSMAAYEGGIWLLGGWSSLRRWGIIGAGAISAIFVMLAAFQLLAGNRRRGEGKGPGKKREEGEWAGQELPRRWELPEEAPPPEEGRSACVEQEEMLMPFKTVPLSASAKEEEDFRCLEPETRGMERIEIRYFPFVIGKQEDLVDFCLKEETVSRLHVRLDREGESFWVTDLNSTNGTMVNGKQLEANETALIQPGDELLIAKIPYRFC